MLQAEPFFRHWFGYSLVNESGTGGDVWGSSSAAGVAGGPGKGGGESGVARYLWASNLEPLPEAFWREWDANRRVLMALT